MNKKNVIFATVLLQENMVFKMENNVINVSLVTSIFVEEKNCIQKNYGKNILKENKRINNCLKSIIVLNELFKER